MIDGLAIVEKARSWTGVKWRHQGRSRQGVDCVGLCLMVADGVGHPVPAPVDYDRRPNGSALLRHLTSTLVPIRTDDPAPGDIALFRDEGTPVHVGVLACQDGQWTVIHAHAARRKVVEEPVDRFAAPFALFRLGGLA
ncbi:NlpC/P60 family protein [Sneathiella chinensis]|uniref:NlpC/P60 domain-containing protein n=1 Tax=Sneathiella chinensis TaxID=349750 RepID=A0ABQ5U7X0_9PROT|nr:NlpC/P60 family protein [Sneathiella chinensis]GLQ07506.1 hypothetical protein GCM10007924_27270 [Sneathiella chinensis]